MLISGVSQKKRNFYKNFNLIISCICSFLCLCIYWFLQKICPYPCVISNIGAKEKLLFAGLSSQIFANFIFGTFFSFFFKNKNYIQYKTIKRWFIHILTIIYVIVNTFFRFNLWNTKISGLQIFLEIIISLVFNYCLVDIIVQIMNEWGICNGFTLLLFINYIPYEWILEIYNKEKSIWLLNFSFIFWITFFVILFTNIKWEIDVETNSLFNDNQENIFFNKEKFPLGFKFNFSTIYLYHFSDIISAIHNLFLMWQIDTIKWFSPESLYTNWNNVSGLKQTGIFFDKFKDNLIKKNKSSNIIKILFNFFQLNETKNMFNINILKKLSKNCLINIFLPSFLILILARFLVMFIQIKTLNLKTNDIIEFLSSRGIYIDKIAPGIQTEKLLISVINKIIFSWFIIILFFNIIFDNLFQSNLIDFNSWFGCVNLGLDLINQIKTRFKYINNN